MEVDVVIVGGGSAGLSAAIRLQQMVNEHNEKNPDDAIEPMIVVLEKAAEVGAHSLSGAVMNPSALVELFPNYKEMDCPILCEVGKEAVYYLGEDYKIKSPIIPPPFKNHGNVIVSLAQMNRWLGAQAEAMGIHVFAGFPAVECLYDGNKVIGVRTGDRGLDKDGNPKENFEPGMIIKAKTTIFADGTRSPLFKHVSKRLGLRKGKNPEVFELGVKEIIQLPKGRIEAGTVMHTLGFPLKKGVGGTFIYGLPNDQVVVGLCVYLDTMDPLLDAHRELQQLKTHPFMKELLEGGEVIAYGGKTLPAGGWFSMPKLYHDGMLVCGDAASMVDVKKLKGVHLAMKSGILAAETVFAAMQKDDFSEESLKEYQSKVENSFIKTDLWATRNFHQTISKGVFMSAPEIMIQEATGGRGLFDHLPIAHTDAEATQPVVDVWGPNGLADSANKLPEPDNKLFFDKLSSVYMTGTMHDEDSPNHLKLQNGSICEETCYPKYKSPCNHFCPANVYEMIDKDGEEGKKLQINYTNCIHCQTCDIKCPFNNIDWTLPEGGGGPSYQLM
ncbi:MAG: electron transfer flavoprotein-ubiquinone oxidoreductase [Bdellovibrionales bacterium]|nr:electron transfer flavoprotein-ubiquinone oxidoreductase [Bdellovibrionales bacterium]